MAKSIFVYYFSKMINNSTSQILVILDLDETLIHATTKPAFSNWDFELAKYKIFIRPNLFEFLINIKSSFRVAVWSSASDYYVEKVVEKIFPAGYPLEFIWGRSKCTLQYDQSILEHYGYSDYYNHLNYVKPLKKVRKQGFATMEKMLIIDDTPTKSRHNYGNAIYPSVYNGNPVDDELLKLIQYLGKLKHVENVRTIEKRRWREKLN